jgi:N-6 DNA Methylase.
MMASLDRNLRKDLENAVKKARRVADAGARQVLEQLAVNHHEPWGALTPEQRKLRNRLRAHGRQLGDRLDEKGTQSIDRLAAECAYEHWHRLLFARFLAENNLLVEPGSGMALSLDECRELARERSIDWLVLASDFAQRMLPQIFRAGDPVLEVTLPPEKRQELEQILEALPRDVFIADDSLGWVYQYWQAEQKDVVNSSGNKIGADELPAATQVFTEDYMVLFLLHNTIGAWWTARRIAQGLSSELPDYSLDYLRFGPDGTPAAGTYQTWPASACDFRLLDPSMGSGHFLAFAMPLLAVIRQVEEGLSREDAVIAVLRDNIFGLEIDPRCTQIAAFNLAMTAWRLGCQRTLPQLNLACSGLGINAKQSTWSALAGDDDRARQAMDDLYSLFNQAPLLGSLIDPTRIGGTLLSASFEKVVPHFERAIAAERDESTAELAVAAWGLTKAARIMMERFTLVITNVPYLGRGKQAEPLRAFCTGQYPDAKADLATCFVQRCLRWCTAGGSVALVTPQNWLFLSTYRGLREQLLTEEQWDLVVKLGPAAFQDMNFWAATTAMVAITRAAPAANHALAGLDVSGPRDTVAKAEQLRGSDLWVLSQRDQLANPDARLSFRESNDDVLLAAYGSSIQGLATHDDPQFARLFWEFPRIINGWEFLCGTVDSTLPYGGRSYVFPWQGGTGRYAENAAALKEEGRLGGWKSGKEAWGRRGVSVSQMRNLQCTLYTGEFFDHSAAVIVPHDAKHLGAIWSFCTSPQYVESVRAIDQAVKVTNASLVKVPFDLEYWRQKAEEDYPRGLPPPHSSDPTQWLFDGDPSLSDRPLHVVVARLLGFRWPRQTGASFVDAGPCGDGGLEPHIDDDGIVGLPAIRGESAAEDRVRALLSQALGSQWSGATLKQILTDEGGPDARLDDWLRDGFFGQHCELFQQRPFVWQVWDGLNNGFSALVNYHKLAAPNGEGRRTLEKLIYTYLGDWIDRQRADQKAGIEGADARVAAAEHLKRELEKILEGEPPYDIFVRWKPLHDQPVGWDPDIDDGVRINIRPFMLAKPLNSGGKKQAKNTCILRVPPKITWDKDRGKEPSRSKADYPWFWGWDEKTPDFLGGSVFDANRWNDLHYSRAVKLAARKGAKGV